jgi:Flp pilus assembly protein TadG
MSLRSFLKDRRAGVAPMFALAVVPVIGLVGAAVDYSRANSIRTKVQSALDATALAMARSAPTLTEEQLQTKSKDYFTGLFNKPDFKNMNVTAAYSTTDGSKLVITATGSVDTTFTRVMGFNSLNVGSSATIRWGQQRLRVALALDTTGSMAGTKIEALRTATKNLIDQLKAAAVNPGDVYVSIIPFSKDVNVGSSGNGSASWLQFDDGTDNSWDGANGTCSKSGGHSPRSVCTATGACSNTSYTSQNGCTSNGTCSLTSYNNQSNCTAAGTCSLTSYTSQSTCTSHGTCSNPSQTSQWSCTNNNACSSGSWGQTSCVSRGYTWGRGTWSPGVWTPGVWTAHVWTPSVWTPNNHSTWNGCVTDRGTASSPGTAAGNDQLVTMPTTSDASTLFYPEQYAYCSPQMKGLSYDWTAMKTLVDGLYPAGSTNQPIGLVWGWQSLVGGGPFGTVPAKDANYVYKEVIIFLSDGLNTQDRWYGNGYDTSTSVDRRMYYGTNGVGTCKNIKDSGVTIYAVQVNTGSDPESQVMKNCASGTDKFVMLTSAEQIVTTFQQIGTVLSQLRIAK